MFGLAHRICWSETGPRAERDNGDIDDARVGERQRLQNRPYLFPAFRLPKNAGTGRVFAMPELADQSGSIQRAGFLDLLRAHFGGRRSGEIWAAMRYREKLHGM